MLSEHEKHEVAVMRPWRSANTLPPLREVARLSRRGCHRQVTIHKLGMRLVKNVKRVRKLEKRGEKVGYLREHDCFVWKPKS